ncbi:MAG: leucine-rich repeat protein, partial [Oscillospiraceae bacterium]|nr:leucine-rich repeat protein [Oscillospiraceae bacterium]
CDNLTEFTLPEQLTTIEDRAFYGCDNLKNIHVSDTVSAVGDYAFQSCKSLTHIVFPKSTVSIGDSVFSGCDNLKGVYIPNEVCAIALAKSTISETAILYGQPGSTTQDYAEEYGRIFVDINSVPTVYHGDVNMDGEFSVTDVIAFQKWLLNSENNFSDWKAADLHTDGIVDGFDLAVMKSKLLKQ